MPIPDVCPMCGGPRRAFRRSAATGRLACGVCGEAVDGGAKDPDLPFEADAGGAADGAGDRVAGPSWGVLIVGLLSGAVTVFWSFGFLLAAVQNPVPQNLDPTGAFATQLAGYYTAMLTPPVTSLAATAAILFGGFQMRTRGSWRWAVAGTVAGMLPCCNLTFVVGLPVGVWALLTLFDPPVRATFR